MNISINKFYVKISELWMQKNKQKKRGGIKTIIDLQFLTGQKRGNQMNIYFNRMLSVDYDNWIMPLYRIWIEYTILGLNKGGKIFEYTKPWNIESYFAVDEVCVWNVTNQCKKAIDNIGIIIRTQYNCAGYRVHPDFLPLLFNLTIVYRPIQIYQDCRRILVDLSLKYRVWLHCRWSLCYVWNIANQCKKAIDNIVMIIRTWCNCVGCQMQPDF